MPANLQPLDDGVSLWLDKPIVLIGRHPECDVQIESRKVSRRHCCIAQVNDYLVIRDLGSTNGIRINGVRVVEGRLTPGDEVTIGNYRYQVNWGSCGDIPASQKANGARNKDAAQASAAPNFDDAMLESCELPVPLPEPEEEPLPRQLKEPSDPVDPEELKLFEELEKPSSDGKINPLSGIIPEVLELAGSKDGLPERPTPPPDDDSADNISAE